MNIRETRELKNFAAQRLSHAPVEKRIVAIYAALTLGMAALVTAANYIIGLQIDNFGGLGNMGIRTVLSSVQTVLPLIQSALTICLDVGYLAAMLRIARGQYVSPQTLRLGFDRFWVLLRCAIFKGLILFANMFAGAYFGIMIYMLSPLSDGVVELLMPYLSDTSILDSTVVLEDAVYLQLGQAMLPAYVICGLVVALLTVPVLYSYRMVDYIIIDRPGMGALAALRESKKMMRGNRLQLFKLDVSLWWYHGAVLGAMVLCYGDVLLPMLGVSFPWHEDISYFLFFALYLALMFVVYYFLRGRAEVAYGLAYDAVKPEEKQDNGGVVLGNIFDM